MKNLLNWKDAAHYGSAVLLLGLAGLAHFGVQLPGVTVDPSVCSAAGISILVAGFKGGFSTGGK